MISNGFYVIIMKKGELKLKKALSVIFALILIGAGVYFLNPELRVRCFVDKYSDEYEQWDGYPSNIGIDYSNVWTNDKGQKMHEMILFSFGITFYGCYYSYDDVPMPFQCLDYELVSEDEDTWSYDGKSSGKTSKIKDNWYYFKVKYNG